MDPVKIIVDEETFEILKNKGNIIIKGETPVMLEYQPNIDKELERLFLKNIKEVIKNYDLETKEYMITKLREGNLDMSMKKDLKPVGVSQKSKVEIHPLERSWCGICGHPWNKCKNPEEHKIRLAKKR